MNKKDLLSKLLFLFGLMPILSGLRGVLLSEVRILAYHRIYDLNRKEEFLFDSDLISASTKEFDWQMEYVRKHYNPVSLSDLIESLDKGRPLSGRPVIVTFDDGFDDNYTKAFPVLKKHNVPATIFLATDYIGKNIPFWFDWLVFVLKNMKTNEILELPGLTIKMNDQDREHVIAKVLGNLKKLPNEERLLVLSQLSEKYSYEYVIDGHPESLPLSWEQVKEMSSWGIEFGSHTLSHPILSRLNDRDLENEVVESKRIIEKLTGKECEVIAYPVGGSDEYDSRTTKVAKKAGYRLGATYRTGTNRLKNISRFELKRLHVETYVTRARFSAMLALPTIFG